MKKLTLFFLLLSSFNLLQAQSSYLLDEKYGYKDLHFETLKSDMMDKIFDCTPQGHCLIAGNSYRNINGIQLENVFVKFYQGKLCAIFITVKGKESVDRLLELYTEAFGKPSKVNTEDLETIWSANKTMLDFTINVDNNGNVSALAIIASKQLMRQYNDADLLKSINDM